MTWSYCRDYISVWWPLFRHLFFTRSKPWHWFPCHCVCLVQGIGWLKPIHPMGWYAIKWKVTISMYIFYEYIFVQCQHTMVKIPRHLNYTCIPFQITPSLDAHWKWLWSWPRAFGMGEGEKTHCFFLHSEALSTVKSGRLTNPSAFSAWNKHTAHTVMNALMLGSKHTDMNYRVYMWKEIEPTGMSVK